MNSKSPSFEENLKSLETIVAKLELGELSLDDAMAEFEKGVKLAKMSQKQLKNAEQKIKILLSEEDEELSEFNIESKESNTAPKKKTKKTAEKCLADDDIPF